MSDIDLRQIHPRAFAHPLDRAALDALDKIPLLPTLIKNLRQFQFEKKFRTLQMHRSIELGPHQLPTLWNMVQLAAERLGMTPPRAYVTAQGGVNAFAFGVKDFSILLTSDLVDRMNDRELEAIIAHELAHVLCQHMLYRQVGLALCNHAFLPLVKTAPTAIVQMGVSQALLSWYRAAEYTADRAALLLLGDPEIIASCMARLAGLPRRFQDEFQPEHFLAQARKCDEEENESFWSKLVKWDMESFMTHPEPVKRAVAILDWASSEDYQKIQAGNYWTWFQEEASQRFQIDGVKSCALCKSSIGDSPVCPQCHLDQDPGRQKYCPRGHLANQGWRFCRICGTELTEPVKIARN